MSNNCSSKYIIMVGCGITCNYHCSYCHENRKRNLISDKSENFLTETNNLNKIADNIYKLKENIEKFRGNREVELLFTGGEPSIFPVEPTAKKIKEVIPSISTVGIITNLSFDPDFYIDLLNNLKKNNLKLRISPSFHEEFQSPSDFINKIRYLFENNIIINNIQFTLTNENWSYLYQLIECLEKLQIDKFSDPYKVIKVSICRNEKGQIVLENDSLKIWEKFKEKENKNIFKYKDFLIQNEIHLKGSKCYVPEDRINITNDGIINFSGNCQQFGNLFDKVSLPREGYLICEQDYCPCYANQRIEV